MCGENGMAEYLIKSLKNQVPLSVILFVLAIIYALSSKDIVPNIPIIGWVDDLTFLAFTTLNIIEKRIRSRDQSRITLSRVILIQVIKWSVMIAGLVAMSVILLTQKALGNLFL